MRLLGWKSLEEYSVADLSSMNGEDSVESAGWWKGRARKVGFMRDTNILRRYNARAQLRGGLACPYAARLPLLHLSFARKGRSSSMPCQLQRLVRCLSQVLPSLDLDAKTCNLGIASLFDC